MPGYDIGGEGLLVSCGDHVNYPMIVNYYIFYLQIVSNEGASPEDRYEYRLPIDRVIIHPAFGVGLLASYILSLFGFQFHIYDACLDFSLENTNND